jgi:DNA-binding NarL/FixJ family response regulator
VLIADDQRVVREGLSMLVALIDDVEVVGMAGDGAEAVRLAEIHRPDVILMDLRMPDLDGIAATGLLRERLPLSRVLVLTTYADEDAIVPALRAGARGYLTKDASAEQIEAAIHAVHAGQTHLDPAVQERLVAAVIRSPDPAGTGTGDRETREGRETRKPPDGLTAREAEVLALLASGLSNAEIGQRLYLSHATVKTHINRIFAKTGVRDRAQAVRYAYQHGLTAPGEEHRGAGNLPGSPCHLGPVRYMVALCSEDHREGDCRARWPERLQQSVAGQDRCLVHPGGVHRPAGPGRYPAASGRAACRHHLRSTGCPRAHRAVLGLSRHAGRLQGASAVLSR